MRDKHVCPKARLLTDDEYRKITAKVVFRLSYPTTCEAIGLALGVNEKTIRRARNEETSLEGKTLMSMFWADREFREWMCAEVGERPVSMDAPSDGVSALPLAAGAVHRLAEATAINSDGGIAITEAELLRMEEDLARAHDSLGGLLTRIADAKKRRAL